MRRTDGAWGAFVRGKSAWWRADVACIQLTVRLAGKCAVPVHHLVEVRFGDRRPDRSVDRSVELLPFSHSSSCGLIRFAICAASVAWRHSAPPSERTVKQQRRQSTLLGRA